MHCIILLPDTSGRVPTAQELRQRGFTVSAAVELPMPRLAAGDAPAEQGRSALALAAEESATYGESRPAEL